MLSLFLIIMLIISISKPDVLLAKKIKGVANEEQKLELAKNLRKVYAVIIGLLESMSLMQYTTLVGCVLAVVCIVLFFTVALPASKRNREIQKELGF